MDQRTNGVDHEPDDPAVLEQEVKALRRELDDVLAELDHRRHELTNWRLQLRRHWRAVAIVGGGMVVLVAGLVALRRHRQHHEQERPFGRLHRLRRALARMIDDSDAAARPAAGKAAISGLPHRFGRH